jgi:hypothetical protein
VARLLAFNIDWYQERHGNMLQEELHGMVRADTPNDENKRLLVVRRALQATGLMLSETTDSFLTSS